jgi:hypothetical protein
MNIYHEYNPAYSDIQETAEFISLYPDFVIGNHFENKSRDRGNSIVISGISFQAKSL